MRQGEIYGLIGPNGAGQDHHFQFADRCLRTDFGRDSFQGQRIDGLRPYEIAARGVSRTFQNIRLFPSMTVLDNVMTACHIHVRPDRCSMPSCARRDLRRDEESILEYCLELLEIFDLVDVRDEGGTSLPYGKQRRLEIVRALATRPQAAAAGRTGGGHEPFRTGRLDGA